MNEPVTAENRRQVALAVGLYALGEYTLGEAAEHAEMSRQQFREILGESSVDLRIGPKDISDAEDEVSNILDF